MCIMNYDAQNSSLLINLISINDALKTCIT